MDSEKKRYNYMEPALQYVMRKITLDKTEIKRNNVILEKVVTEIVEHIKKQSPLFRSLYRDIFWGGSYYDGLKVEKPEEYDLDLLMTLPRTTEIRLSTLNDVPGFVSIDISVDSETKCYKEIQSILDGCHLSTEKVRRWMEGLVTKALKKCKKIGSQAMIIVNENKYFIKTTKSGPAYTLNLTGPPDENGKPVQFDVDLVPCFVCDINMWPSYPFRKNPIPKDKPTFFIVPKEPKHCGKRDIDHCWRLSFQEQERALIKRKKSLKPTIKLLKKLRDINQHKSISSYFIKTVALWEIDQQNPIMWQENSFSHIFIRMLQAYTDRLLERRIPYYWNEENNLIENLGTTALTNYANRMKKICDDLNKHGDPIMVVSLFLSKSETDDFCKNVMYCKE